MTKVSVIVPVHNTGIKLRKCLDSLTHQTYSNLEIIVIDDASTENIQEHIAAYKESIIFHRSEKQLKPGGARNKGLSYATGEYVCFFDSDDWGDLNLIETTVEYMLSNDADIGMYTLKRSYDTPMENPIYKCKYDTLVTLSGEMAFKIVTGEYDMGVKVIPPVTNKIFKRSFLENNQIVFAENLFYEDLLFTVETFLQSKKIICIPNAIYHHYRRPGSIIQSIERTHIDDYFKVAEKIYDFMIEKNYFHQYKFNYYKFIERYHNLIIRQIFEFSTSEVEKKQLLSYSFKKLKEKISYDDYFEYKTAEELRQHIQPQVKSTAIL